MKPATLYFDRHAAILRDGTDGATSVLCQVPFATNTPSVRAAAAAYLLGYAAARGYQIVATQGVTPHLNTAARFYVRRLSRLLSPSPEPAAPPSSSAQ